jgi:kinesin family protein 11
LQAIQEALDTIKSTGASEADALEAVQNTLKETHETFKTGFGTWSEGLKKTYGDMNRQVEQTGLDAFLTVEAALKTMASLVETIVFETQEYVDTELQKTREANALASDTSNNEIVRLKQQNESLVRLLDSQQIRADKAKDELIQRISSLLGDFTKERDKDLRAAISTIQTENKQAASKVRTFAGQHGAIMDSMETAGAEMSATLKTRGGEGKRNRDGAYKVGRLIKTLPKY